MEELSFPYRQQRPLTPVIFVLAFLTNVLTFYLVLERVNGDLITALQRWGFFNQALTALFAAWSVRSLWLAIEDWRNPQVLILDATGIAVVARMSGARSDEVPYDQIFLVTKVGFWGLQSLIVRHRQGSLKIPISRLPNQAALNQIESRLRART